MAGFLFLLRNVLYGEYGHCPIEHIRDFSCQVEDHIDYQNLTITFLTHRIDGGKKMVKAKPFNTYQINETRLCQIKYDGPMFYMLEKINSRVCSLLPVEVEGDNVPLPREGECMEPFPENSTDLWNSVSCKIRNESFPLERDVRWINGAYQIQCFGSKLSMNGVIQECPPYVFRISPNINFTVGDRTHRYFSVNVVKSIGMSEVWTSMINVRIPTMPKYKALHMPVIHEYNAPKVFRQLTKYVPLGMQSMLFWIMLVIFVIIIQGG